MSASQWLPVAFQLVALALKWFGAKQDTLEAFKNLIEKSHNEGLITVETKDVFLKQKEQMEKALNEQKG